MTIEELLKKGSCAVYTEEDFLRRENNIFNTAVRTVILTDGVEKVAEKIKNLFGAVEYSYDGEKVVIEPIDLFSKDRFSFSDLTEIVYRLRDPDGCPWDRAQTAESIRKNIVEEAYELVEGIDLKSTEKMREEAGDVALQTLLLSSICRDEGLFSIDDVVTDLCVKLINRHTHIFGKDKANSAEEALAYWDKAKAKEKKYTSVKDKVASIPITFGALMYAEKLQKYIKKTGFDFPDVDGAIAKIYEEVEEFKQATGEDREKEGGDMLFSVVNVLRMCDIDAETALNGTSNRFKRRFFYVIDQAEKEGRKVEDLSLDEMEKYYQESKDKV